MARRKSISSEPGGVDQYIARCPKDVQDKLEIVMSTICAVAPGATETVSYFQMPGYSYNGYDYNGMFVWFSFKSPFVRVHVRPPVIENHKTELAGYPTTKAIVSIHASEDMPIALIEKLVEASITVMKEAK